MGYILGIPIFNNAVNGTVGATGISACGTFVVGSTICSNANSNNFYPTVQSALISKGLIVPNQVSALYDFNGKVRSTATPTVGAYVSCLIQ